MKKVFLNLVVVSLFSTISLPSRAQDDSADDIEAYVKTNVALTKFKILGVTQKQYAKCLSTENFADPTRNLKFLVIDKTIFADDGQGYDMVSGDGILTSNQLFLYSGTTVIPQGSYQNSPSHDVIVADQQFGFFNNTSERGWGFSFGCKFRWVPCNEMAEPQKTLCNLMGWPRGTFVVSECEIKFTL